MKNWKSYRIITFLLILFLAFIFIACENEEQKKCNCNEKTHLDEEESCACGGVDCKCTFKLNIILVNDTTKVWKETEVSEDDFYALVESLNEMINYVFNEPARISFKNNIIKIRIQQGIQISHNGNVLIIGSNIKNNPENTIPGDPLAVIVPYLVNNGLVVVQ